MSFLTFDAIGRLALGQNPGANTTAISARATCQAKSRVQMLPKAVLAAKVTTMVKARAPTIFPGVMSARVTAMAKARVPGGVAMSTVCKAMATGNTSPGYLLNAKIAAMATASALPQVKAVVPGPRKPLYLVGAGGGGVSYWPDGSGQFKDG